MAIQLLLVNFLYSPPGLLQIAEAQLPEWLLSDYRSIFEQSVTNVQNKPSDFGSSARNRQPLQPATELPQLISGYFRPPFKS